jgi:hemerythrin-like domain-containing protein
MHTTTITTTITAPDLGHARPVVVVHTAFRRELRLAGPAVRRVRSGDTHGSQVVAGHLHLVLQMLEHHHTLEDELVWPRLRERTPGHPVVDRMEDQHAVLAARLEEVTDRLAAWRRSATAHDRDRLADALDELHHALTEHLDDEERHLLPIAVAHLEPAEWEEIGRRAEAAHDRDRALVFGILQYEGDPVVVASMLRSAPLPARLLVPVLARRAFRRRATAVHGTPTP